MKSQINEFILEMNQCNCNNKNWQDKGINKAPGYENEKAKQKKDFDEQLILAQKPTRSRFGLRSRPSPMTSSLRGRLGCTYKQTGKN